MGLIDKAVIEYLEEVGKATKHQKEVFKEGYFYGILMAIGIYGSLLSAIPYLFSLVFGWGQVMSFSFALIMFFVGMLFVSISVCGIRKKESDKKFARDFPKEAEIIERDNFRREMFER
jgi:predicted membrane protein